jgi:hypothetical protein
VSADLATRLREMAGPQGWLPPWSHWWGDPGEAYNDEAARARELGWPVR